MFKKCRRQIPDGKLVQVLRVFILVESVVKFEFSVLYVLRNAVHLQLRLMHHDQRIAGRASVDLADRIFLLKQRPLADANADIHG